MSTLLTKGYGLFRDEDRRGGGDRQAGDDPDQKAGEAGRESTFGCHARVSLGLVLAAHRLGGGNAQEREAVGEHAAGGREQREAGVAFGFVLDDDALGVVERVERGGEVLQVVAEHVGRMVARRLREHLRVFGDGGEKLPGGFTRERGEVRTGEFGVGGNRVALLKGLREDRADARMGVLQVVDRVLVALLLRERHVEDEFGVALARGRGRSARRRGPPIRRGRGA